MKTLPASSEPSPQAGPRSSDAKDNSAPEQTSIDKAPSATSASPAESAAADKTDAVTEQKSQTSAAPPAKAEKPAMPPGFDAAEKAFKEKKYAAAARQFEQFLKEGFNDEKIHDYLAQCYYYQRLYRKSIKEYQWAANNARSLSTKNAAANTARVLTCYMAGVCPGPCLNPNSSHWKPDPQGRPGLWWREPRVDGSYQNFSQVHAGDQIMRNNLGNPYVDDRIKCPICRGTGRTKILKDGQPL